jgi:hypothetical protein
MKTCSRPICDYHTKKLANSSFSITWQGQSVALRATAFVCFKKDPYELGAQNWSFGKIGLQFSGVWRGFYDIRQGESGFLRCGSLNGHSHCTTIPI